MIILWNGLGFLVPVITFGCLLLTEFAIEAAFHDDHYYQAHGWPKLVGFVSAALIVWPLARYLRPKPARALVGPLAQDQVVSQRSHSLFFIPMEYWGPILLLLGIVFLFVTD
jgi:hypothetical protein